MRIVPQQLYYLMQWLVSTVSNLNYYLLKLLSAPFVNREQPLKEKK